MTNIAIEDGTLILDLPIQNGDFPQVVIYVSLPEIFQFAKGGTNPTTGVDVTNPKETLVDAEHTDGKIRGRISN